MKLDVKHLPSDYPTDAPSVDELLAHLAQQSGVNLEAEEETDADYIAGYDDGEAEPSNDEANSQ